MSVANVYIPPSAKSKQSLELLTDLSTRPLQPSTCCRRYVTCTTGGEATLDGFYSDLCKRRRHQLSGVWAQGKLDHCLIPLKSKYRPIVQRTKQKRKLKRSAPPQACGKQSCLSGYSRLICVCQQYTECERTCKTLFVINFWAETKYPSPPLKNK